MHNRSFQGQEGHPRKTGKVHFRKKTCKRWDSCRKSE